MTPEFILFQALHHASPRRRSTFYRTRSGDEAIKLRAALRLAARKIGWRNVYLGLSVPPDSVPGIYVEIGVNCGPI